MSRAVEKRQGRPNKKTGADESRAEKMPQRRRVKGEAVDVLCSDVGRRSQTLL